MTEVKWWRDVCMLCIDSGIGLKANDSLAEIFDRTVYGEYESCPQDNSSEMEGDGEKQVDFEDDPGEDEDDEAEENDEKHEHGEWNYERDTPELRKNECDFWMLMSLNFQLNNIGRRRFELCAIWLAGQLRYL